MGASFERVLLPFDETLAQFLPTTFFHDSESHVSLLEQCEHNAGVYQLQCWLDDGTVCSHQNRHNESTGLARVAHLCQSGHAQDLSYFIAGSSVPRRVPPNPEGRGFFGQCAVQSIQVAFELSYFPGRCCSNPATWNRAQGHSIRKGVAIYCCNGSGTTASIAFPNVCVRAGRSICDVVG
jgi:hypothetical protein